MSNDEQIYKKYLDILRLKLIAKYNELGLKASGKYEQALEGVVKGNTMTMYGAYHSQFMEYGRSSGRFPPRSAIEEWIDTKQGLPQIFRDKKKSFAFLIARKIATEGIVVPNEYNAGGIISDVVNDFLGDDLDAMFQELGEFYLARITSDVVSIFKSIF
jgi:hypothetical protein